MSLIPKSGKAEFHITYKCNLSCLSCSRASWLKEPHTPDMTLDHAREFFRQADEIGLKGRPRHHEEGFRLILIGGEPTLHPDFMEFVRICTEWSGKYVQVYSNGYTPKAKELCERAFRKFGASIHRDSWKTESVSLPEQYKCADWWWETFVSPADAGLDSPHCYIHASQICGMSVDSEGYSACTIGASMRALRGLPRTKVLADLFDEDKVTQMTHEECAHCGYEYTKRGMVADKVAEFNTFAQAQPMSVHGCHMSPTWVKAFEGRTAKPNLPYDPKRLPVVP